MRFFERLEVPLMFSVLKALGFTALIFRFVCTLLLAGSAAGVPQEGFLRKSQDEVLPSYSEESNASELERAIQNNRLSFPTLQQETEDHERWMRLLHTGAPQHMGALGAAPFHAGAPKSRRMAGGQYTPVFQRDSYDTQLPENAALGTHVVTVRFFSN